MDMFTDLTFISLVATGAYILLDLVLAIILKRCVLPGLKCRECKSTKGTHGVSPKEFS